MVEFLSEGWEFLRESGKIIDSYSETPSKGGSDMISESMESLLSLKVSESSNKSTNKRLFFDNITMQAEKRNKNKRIYPSKVLSEAITSHIKRMGPGRLCGELNHPDDTSKESMSINPKNISHRFISVDRRGNDFYTKSIVTESLPMGRLVKDLTEKEGILLGMSSRAVGRLNKDKVVEALHIISMSDIVFDQSAPDAFCNAVYENKNWVGDLAEDNGGGELIERTKRKLSGITQKEWDSAALGMFEAFVKQISKS